jgi:pyruvate kinase
MSKICTEAEGMIQYKKLHSSLSESIGKISKLEEEVIKAVLHAEESQTNIIVTFTKSGKIAQLLSKYRPRQTIVAYW